MRRGFTLLEVILVLAISSLILIGFTTAVLVSQRTQGNVAVVSDLESDAHEALQMVADQLRAGGAVGTDWTLTSDSVTFSLCTGETGGVKTWGSPRLLSLNPYAPGEDDITDGVDNNGNGITDEAMLVLSTWDGAAAHEQGLVTGVPSGGLVFSQNGNDIAISLTLVRLNEDGLPMMAQATTVVSPRNWE